MAKREQHVYPTCIDGTMNNSRAPYMSDKQAFGYKGNYRIEYVITGTTTGYSDESGETLWQAYVRKIDQREDPTCYAPGYPFVEDIQLYVNEKGDAYRSWKGELRGRPVCNFHTGFVYYYGKERKFA